MTSSSWKVLAESQRNDGTLEYCKDEDDYAGDNWTTVGGVAGKQVENSDGDVIMPAGEIEEGTSDEHRIFLYFNTRPDKVVQKDCNSNEEIDIDQGKNDPESVNFSAFAWVGGDTTTEELYFDRPSPNSKRSDNSIVGAAFDLVGLSSNLYIQVGSIFLDYLINPVPGPDLNLSPSGESIYWDLPLRDDNGGSNGYEGLPHINNDEANSVGMNFRTHCDTVRDGLTYRIFPSYTARLAVNRCCGTPYIDMKSYNMVPRLLEVNIDGVANE